MTSEETPLLGGTLSAVNSNSRTSFRRIVPLKGSAKSTDTEAAATVQTKRQSLRGIHLPDQLVREVQPVDGLSPLATGASITTTDGYTTHPRPVSTVKSLPAFVPFRRTARHRSYLLWWINQFRHWWKSSRLLVRLAGLFTLAFTAGLFLQRMMDPGYVTPYLSLPQLYKHGHKRANKAALKAFHKTLRKNSKHAVKIVKRLGQGGPMRFFLNYVHPFTRSLRLLMAAWRWYEAAQCRRGEVGTEEAFAFMGNRVSRMLARLFVDSAVAYLVMPLAYQIFRFDAVLDRQDTDQDLWHPLTLFVVLGCMRAVAPYAASFQGSRAGRVLTRSFFKSALHRWHPIQPVHRLNLTSDDACERDEISQTADLAKMGKLVAKALGKAQQIGKDGMAGQRQVLELEGFRQIGAGSGGYAVYECHRRVWTTTATEAEAASPRNQNNNKSDTDPFDNDYGKGEFMTILLHVTPYGPSILDVMPRYIVLEFEDSVDRRAKWSEFISKRAFDGPPVVEGYCYAGAFFSPHHFAELKTTYDKQLVAYERACASLCKPRTGRQPNPPLDLASLKQFLANGKLGKKRRRNNREAKELQKGIHSVANELKDMMNASKHGKCIAPKGVILYFEGLDCAGKSSTGGLVEQALKEAGYDVGMVQYNRPPTAEQKLKPWMDRFQVPKTSAVALAIPKGSGENGDEGEPKVTHEWMKDCIDTHHSALVWDRGPAGDFVYNPTYRAMPQHDRKKRYREFMDFDKKCFDNGILFLKLLFVTNRDSIASTLGKRLAQKKMARDLRTWHKASRGDDSAYGDMGFEGLDEIELHIDPTDFVAFNSYQKNIRIFTNFARSTDSRENPWIVVNTGDRYAARKALLRAFRKKLDRFKDPACCGGGDAALSSSRRRTAPVVPISEDETVDIGYAKPLPIQLLVALAGLLLVAYYYCEHTQFGNPFKDTIIRVEDLLEDENTTSADGAGSDDIVSNANRHLMAKLTAFIESP